MKIEGFDNVQMIRTNEQHFGSGKIGSGSSAKPSAFQNYLVEAMNAVNTQQMDVTKIQEKLITNPDEVDVHDVTIAMSKARMSLNLAQTVIDRLVSDWNEITTTR